VNFKKLLLSKPSSHTISINVFLHILIFHVHSFSIFLLASYNRCMVLSYKHIFINELQVQISYIEFYNFYMLNISQLHTYIRAHVFRLLHN